MASPSHGCPDFDGNVMKTTTKETTEMQKETMLQACSHINEVQSAASILPSTSQDSSQSEETHYWLRVRNLKGARCCHLASFVQRQDVTAITEI